MKKIFLFFVSIVLVTGSFAQKIDAASALKIVASNSASIGLSSTDLQQSIVSDAYYNKTAGTQMIYLQQSYHGIPVYNQIQTLAFKNGVLVSNAGSRLRNLDSKLATASKTPSITAETAISIPQ